MPVPARTRPELGRLGRNRSRTMTGWGPGAYERHEADRRSIALARCLLSLNVFGFRSHQSSTSLPNPPRSHPHAYPHSQVTMPRTSTARATPLHQRQSIYTRLHSSASGIRGATTSPLPQQAFISSDAAASTSYSTFPSSSTSTQSFEPAQFEQYTTPTSSTALAEFTPLSRTEAARKHVPRPMNCFMLYMQVQRQGKTSEEHENDFVKRMGAVWRGMAESEKDLWRRRAQVADLEHKRLYPDYKFQPKLPRKGKKGAKSAKGTTQPKMNRRKATIATTHAVAKPVSSSSLSQAQGLFTEEACEPETFPVASVAPTAQWDHSSSMYQQMLTSQTGTLSPLLEDVDTSASAWALPAMAQSLDFSVHPTPPMYSPYLRALGQDATFGDSSTRQAQTYSASAHNDLPLSVLSSLEFASDMDLNVPFQGYPSFLSATPLDMFYCSPYSPSSSYSGSSLPPPDFASDTLNPWPGQGSCVGSHLHLAEPQHHLFGSLDVNPPCPWPSSSWSG